MTEATVTELDPLDTFATAGTDEALKILLWKHRFEDPSFTVQVTPEDLKGFADCIEYLKVQPKIHITRPGGVPGRPAQQVGKKLIPGREAIPPKNYVIVQMVDQDGDAFVPIENNEADRDRQIAADSVRRAKERAKALAGQLQSDLAAQTFSTSTIQEAIAALNALSA